MSIKDFFKRGQLAGVLLNLALVLDAFNKGIHLAETLFAPSHFKHEVGSVIIHHACFDSLLTVFDLIDNKGH